MTTTAQRPTSTATIQVGNIQVGEDRITISAVPLLRNGDWGQFPANYYVWKNSSGAAFGRALQLQKGHILKVTYLENLNPTGTGVFKNVTSIERPDVPNAPGPEPAPAQTGTAPSGWSPPPPSSSPMRDAEGLRRASIEAQVAVKVASDLVRDLMPGMDTTPEQRMGVIVEYLPKLTLIAMRAIQAAREV